MVSSSDYDRNEPYVPSQQNIQQNRSVELPPQLIGFKKGDVLQYTIAKGNTKYGSNLKERPYNLTLQSPFSSNQGEDAENYIAFDFKADILYDSPSNIVTVDQKATGNPGVLIVTWGDGEVIRFVIDGVGHMDTYGRREDAVGIINIENFTPHSGGRGRSRRRTKKSKRSKRIKSVRRRR